VDFLDAKVSDPATVPFTRLSMSEENATEEPVKGLTRVWVVEDNETLRRTVARVLDRQKDMQCVHQFERCETAIESLVAGERPDVMLFDIGLPGMSGIEGIRRIKTALPQIEILVFSVFDDNEKVFNAICAGASGYLLKTSSMGEIPDAIREILAGGAPINALIARRVLDMFSELAPQSRDYGLTEREKEVLVQMVGGLTKKEIADQLDLSFHTVDKHIRGIYSKLHVNTMTGAVAKALKEGLLPKT
jgi:DNA-binding NarL/FixJ family response regulator